MKAGTSRWIPSGRLLPQPSRVPVATREDVLWNASSVHLLPLPVCAAGTVRDTFSYILATAGSKGDSVSLTSPRLPSLRKKKRTDNIFHFL